MGPREGKELEKQRCGMVAKDTFNQASIFSAELCAIIMAVRAIEELQRAQFVVFSDSGSVLKALMRKRNCHPVTRKLQHDIAHLKSKNKEVSYVVYPGMLGYRGMRKLIEWP